MSENLAARVWPTVASNWIWANVYSALLSSIASFGFDRLAILGYMLGDYAQIFNLIVGIIFFGIAGLIGGFLTGTVLKIPLPTLPMRKWIILSGAIGVFFGALIGFFSSPDPTSNDDRWPLELELLLVTIFGAIVGGTIGGLQARVLRTTAHGLVSWITWSSFAFAIGFGIQIYSGKLLEALGGWNNWMNNEIATFIANIIIAVVMLPAVARLKWRNPM